MAQKHDKMQLLVAITHFNRDSFNQIRIKIEHPQGEKVTSESETCLHTSVDNSLSTRDENS